MRNDAVLPETLPEFFGHHLVPAHAAHESVMIGQQVDAVCFVERAQYREG